ncbi:MAG: RIP metalloprotease RseP [Verrucomicrobiia bacterium]
MPFEKLIQIIADWIYPGLLVVFFFGLTIFVHELGHFLIAKRRGMLIERFSIGFGPKIWGWTKDRVDYRISWFPFGGYVALPQMSPMEALEGKTEARAEDVPPATPSTRILVAVAGPIMNLALAVVLAALVYQFGLPTPINPSVVGWVEPGSREEQLGIRVGDRIVQVNDQKVSNWNDLNQVVALSEGPNVKIVIERDGNRQEYLLETEINPVFKIKTVNLYPQGRPFASKILPRSPAERAGFVVGDKFVSVDGIPVSTREELINLISKRGNQPTTIKVMRRGKIQTIVVTPELNPDEKVARIGVQLDDEIEFQLVQPGPTPVAQFRDTFEEMGKTFNAILHYKRTKVGIGSVSGPLGISVGWWMQITHGGVRRGLWFAVIINIALAVFNLLPIPVLDGGHVMFALIEAARHRPVNARVVHVTTMACATLLISFMLYVTFNDFQRFISWPHNVAPKSQTNEPAPQP